MAQAFSLCLLLLNLHLVKGCKQKFDHSYTLTTHMRILHISTRLILGGSQENTLLSCEGQARLGHDVHLAYGPILGPEGSLLDRATQFRTSTGKKITTHQVPNLVREVAPRTDQRGRIELRRLIEMLSPDIVHTHSSKAGILGRLAAWDASQTLARERNHALGVVHTIHGPPFMPIEGGPLHRCKVRLMNVAYSLAERKAANRCDAIVSVADAMTTTFLARGIGTPSLYTTVRSGMEIEPYSSPAAGESRDEIRARLGLASTDFVVGTVARLAQHKGHDDVLDALGPLLQTHLDWKLLWVGDGWWRQRLLARARALGIVVAELDSPALPHEAPVKLVTPAQLILTGLVLPTRIPGLMRGMDLLVHPSYREGLPRTVPQALLSNVCPVAYDVDGTREACKDQETGLLVPLGDIAGLRRAVERLYADSDARRRFAHTGHDWCVTEFDARRMVAQLFDVYQHALAHARTRLELASAIS